MDNHSREPNKSWPITVSNLIKVGEQLHLNKPQTIQKSLLVDYKISPYLEQNEPTIPTVAVDYQVKPGDSIWRISRLYDVPHKDVAMWNKLNATSVLKPGTILTLHLPQAEPTKHNAPASETILSGIESSLKKP